jgi:hypothetical protein
MLSVIMLSVIMLSVIMLSVIMLSVIMLSVAFYLLLICRYAVWRGAPIQLPKKLTCSLVFLVSLKSITTIFSMIF